MFATLPGGDGNPPEPDWTTLYKDDIDLKIARDLWRSICSEMREAQTLAVSNGPAIKRLVAFNIEFERQVRSVAEDGAVRAAKRTKVPQVHPSWTVMKQAAEAAGALEAELGISPRRRSAVAKVQRKAKRATAADEFLKPIAR